MSGATFKYDAYTQFNVTCVILLILCDIQLCWTACDRVLTNYLQLS